MNKSLFTIQGVFDFLMFELALFSFMFGFFITLSSEHKCWSHNKHWLLFLFVCVCEKVICKKLDGNSNIAKLTNKHILTLARYLNCLNATSFCHGSVHSEYENWFYLNTFSGIREADKQGGQPFPRGANL